MQQTGSIRKHIAIPRAVAKCQFLTDILINNAYMDYLEVRFSEIMKNKVKKEFILNEFQQVQVEMKLVNCQVNVVKDVSNQQEKQT